MEENEWGKLQFTKKKSTSIFELIKQMKKIKQQSISREGSGAAKEDATGADVSDKKATVTGEARMATTVNKKVIDIINGYNI